MQFPLIITNRRKQLKLTQEQVAQFIGVSRAAVSKWEQGLSYPDIALLPKLAMYFDMSIDDLLGYEPQLTTAAIEKIYSRLAKEFTEKPFDEVLAETDKLVSEYYSCYPFIVKMVQLYINHLNLADRKEEMMRKTLALCHRVKENCHDIQLINEVTAMEALCYITSQQPEKVLQLLGDEVTIQYGLDQLIATAHNMLGNVEKAKVLMQIAYYQQLMTMLHSAIETLTLDAENADYTEKTIARIEAIFDLYDITNLNLNTVFVFYLKAVTVNVIQGNIDEAKRLLAKYMRTCIQMKLPLKIKGDSYFYLFDDWVDQQSWILTNLPRDEEAIKHDLIQALSNPIFESLLEDPDLKVLFETMKIHLTRGGN